MSVLLLSTLIAVAPLDWDGRVWTSLEPDAKIAWASGVVSAFAMASYIRNDPRLAVRATPSSIIASLDIFYGDPSNWNLPVANALLYLSGGSRMRKEN